MEKYIIGLIHEIMQTFKYVRIFKNPKSKKLLTVIIYIH